MTEELDAGLGDKERGCGVRAEGGLYLCSELAEGGWPLSSFIVDPVSCATEMVRHGLSRQGVEPVFQGGFLYLVDWVGASHYPTPGHFVEEASRLGISRRIPWSDAVPAALRRAKAEGLRVRLAFVHASAYDPLPRPDLRLCTGATPGPASAVALWNCGPDAGPEAGPGEVASGLKPFEAPQRRLVTLPCGDAFYGGEAPSDVLRRLGPGVFMAVPLTHLEAVNDPGDPEFYEKLARMRSETPLPIRRCSL